MTLAAVCFAFVTLSLCVTFSSADKCNLQDQSTVLADDIAPAAFAVTSYQCCQNCWTDSNCQAAVYNTSTYLCHLKGASGPVGAAPDGIVIFPYKPTPAPTPVPTAAPPHAAKLAGVTTCSYGPYCSLREGGQTCTTAAYIAGACTVRYDPHTGVTSAYVAKCRSESVELLQYANSTTCDGSYHSTVIPNTCNLLPSLVYQASFCADVTVTPAPIGITSTTCAGYGCDGNGLGCSGTGFTNGQCQSGPSPWQPFNSPTSLLSHNKHKKKVTATLSQCFAGWIVYTQYAEDQQCGGKVQYGDAFAVPNDVCFEYMVDFSQKNQCKPAS